MNTKNNNNEIVTRGILRESFKEFAVAFAIQMEKLMDRKFDMKFAELETRFGSKMDQKIDTKIGGLAIMMEKGFTAVTKDIAVLGECIITHQKYTQGVIPDLQVRVGKLEKKMK